MPIEIRELIIRVIVSTETDIEEAEKASYDTIQKAVEQIMDVLEKAKER